MLALCRLAERQGILTGDLNHLQRMALHEVMLEDVKHASDEKFMDFKAATLAANLENAKEILDMFAKMESETASGGFAKTREMQPLTASDKQAMLSEFRSLGLPS